MWCAFIGGRSRLISPTSMHITHYIARCLTWYLLRTIINQWKERHWLYDLKYIFFQFIWISIKFLIFFKCHLQVAHGYYLYLDFFHKLSRRFVVSFEHFLRAETKITNINITDNQEFTIKELLIEKLNKMFARILS